MESRPLSAYYGPILTYLERFNQNGAFTVERGYDGFSFAEKRKKLSEQFLRNLGFIGI